MLEGLCLSSGLRIQAYPSENETVGLICRVGSSHN